METRPLETMEMIGTEVIFNKTGKVIGTIVGCYVGGFKIKAVYDNNVCMLPFKSINNYSVKL